MNKTSNLNVFLFIFLLSGCSSPTYPEFKSLKDVRFTSIGLDQGEVNSRLKADAIFYNPNSIGATVTGMDFEVYIEDLLVTHLNQNLSVEIKGNSVFVLPIEFEVPLKSLFENGKPKLGVFLNKKSIPYRLKGSIEVKLGSLSIDIPVDYEDEEPLVL
jgi:LEA14-like dessication related protein